MKSTYVVLALGLFALGFAAPAAAGPAEQMLPEDTLFVLSVDNFTESRARMKAHPLYALYNEPDFQKFIEKPMAKIEEMMESSAVKPGEIIELIQGQACLAVTGAREVAKGTHWMGGVMLLDFGENEAKFAEKFKAAEAEMFETETHRRVEEQFHDVTIVTYLPREGEVVVEGAGVTEGPACWFLSKGIWAVSSDPEVLKSLIVRRDDPEAAGLGANAEYKAVLARLEGTGDTFMFVNADSMWKLVEENLGESGIDQSPEEFMTLMGQLGLREPRSMGISMALTAEGVDQKVYIHSPEPRTGIMKFFDSENSALMPPRFVPPDVASVYTMSIDFQGLWAEARRIMDEIKPGMTEEMDQQFAQMKEQMGIDIQADLIGSLGKSMTVYQFEPKPADPDAPFPMPQQRAVIAIEVSNAEKMQATVDALLNMAAMFGMMPETEEYLGVKIKSINAGMVEVGIGVVADHLVIATVKDDLKQLIASLGKEDVKTLVDSEDFRAAMAGLPRMRNMVTYSDSRRAIDSVAEQMKLAAMMEPEISEWLDMSLLPTDLLKKYFGVAGGVMVREEEGIYMISRSRMQMPSKAPATPDKPAVPEKAPETPEQPADQPK